MRLEIKKHDCTFQFMLDDVPHSASSKYQGLFQLFEHEYDAQTRFWYGVADITCTYKDIKHVQQQGKMSDFRVTVFLPDGRIGACRLLNSEHVQDMQSLYTRVALVGWTTLASPPTDGR